PPIDSSRRHFPWRTGAGGTGGADAGRRRAGADTLAIARSSSEASGHGPRAGANCRAAHFISGATLAPKGTPVYHESADAFKTKIRKNPGKFAFPGCRIDM